MPGRSFSIAEIGPEDGNLALFGRSNRVGFGAEGSHLIHVVRICSTVQPGWPWRHKRVDVWQAKRINVSPLWVKRGAEKWGRSSPLSRCIAGDVRDLGVGAVRAARV